MFYNSTHKRKVDLWTKFSQPFKNETEKHKPTSKAMSKPNHANLQMVSEAKLYKKGGRTKESLWWNKKVRPLTKLAPLQKNKPLMNSGKKSYLKRKCIFLFLSSFLTENNTFSLSLTKNLGSVLGCGTVCSVWWGDRLSDAGLLCNGARLMWERERVDEDKELGAWWIILIFIDKSDFNALVKPQTILASSRVVFMWNW